MTKSTRDQAQANNCIRQQFLLVLPLLARGVENSECMRVCVKQVQLCEEIRIVNMRCAVVKLGEEAEGKEKSRRATCISRLSIAEVMSGMK